MCAHCARPSWDWLGRGLGVYIELARGYQRRKKFPRR
jgi:hypothetical protein